MATLFGNSPAAAAPPDIRMRVQTSIEGAPRTIFCGVTRAAGNLIWYNDFYAVTVSSGGSSGGKGGLFGAPAGTGSSYDYFASVEIALGEQVAAIGPVMWASKSRTTLDSIGGTGGSLGDFGRNVSGLTVGNVGFGIFLGDQVQLPWSYLTTAHPDQAFAYRLTSYLAVNAHLGSSAELPNWSFEVTAKISNSIPGILDADATLYVADILTNGDYGVPGWVAAYLDDWSYARGYLFASGMLISYAWTSQTRASSFLNDLLTSLNVMPVWSEKKLKLVPRGDQPIVAGTVTPRTISEVIPAPINGNAGSSFQVATPATFVADDGVIDQATSTSWTSIPWSWFGSLSLVFGQYMEVNGVYVFPATAAGRTVTINYSDAAVASYNPPTAPIYDLTDTDFLPNQSSFGGVNADPVSGQQKPPRTLDNIVKVEFLDRSNDYNPATTQATDDGAILLYGERGSKGVQAWHWFQYRSAADMAAQLALGREKILNNYSITLRPRFVLLEPGDIVTITDPGLGLARQWVRILDIQENQDRSFNFLVEEYLDGTGASPLYGRQAGTGSLPNYSADPGGINAPLLFEPTDELAGGLEVWAAVSGVNPALYGGSDAYVSYDGATFSKVSGGRQFGSARMGLTTTDLPPVAANPAGPPTIDAVNVLGVNLAESAGQLISGTQIDALNLNTACWIGGEVIAYQTAALTAPSAYNLSYLVRGGFGTEASIVDHPVGTPFARLDTGILRVPYDQGRIGSTIYLKFLPFNIWGVTVSTLADVPAYPYKLTGAALASPLPPVTLVRTVFEAGFTKLWWQEVEDFRSGIRYIIRKGDSFAGGQDLGTVAHPPFVCFGAGTYWIMPTCQPVAGLIVFGENAVSLTIQGNMLTANIVQTTNFQTAGWPGIFTNVGKEGSDPTAFLRLVSTADVLTDPNILVNPDVLNSGVVASNGIYAADASAGLNVGYVADCYLNITWQSAGLPVGTDILTDADFLNNPDVLNAAGGAFVDVWIEVRTATTSTGDMFGPSDMFGPDVPDLFDSGVQWGAWQRYVPGVYRAQYIQYRAVFNTIDPKIVAYLLSLVVQVSIPARIDHYIGNSVGIGGLTIVFMPDDAILSKPFNGGPLVGGTSNHPLPAVSMDWPGHPDVNFKIDSLTLSQVTFHFEDATTAHVAVTGVDTYVEGY